MTDGAHVRMFTEASEHPAKKALDNSVAMATEQGSQIEGRK
jgi:hypothetical protein